MLPKQESREHYINNHYIIPPNLPPWYDILKAANVQIKGEQLAKVINHLPTLVLSKSMVQNFFPLVMMIRK